jgi:hypothetical protein
MVDMCTLYYSFQNYKLIIYKITIVYIQIYVAQITCVVFPLI